MKHQMTIVSAQEVFQARLKGLFGPLADYSDYESTYSGNRKIRGRHLGIVIEAKQPFGREEKNHLQNLVEELYCPFVLKITSQHGKFRNAELKWVRTIIVELDMSPWKGGKK